MKQCVAQLLGLQGGVIYQVKIDSGRIEVYAGRPQKEATCPFCRTLTRQVHDRSREWRPKLHTWCNGLPVYLWVRPRRFKCPRCGKVFTERFPSIKPWARRTAPGRSRVPRKLERPQLSQGGRSSRGKPRRALRRLLLKQVTNQVKIEEALERSAGFCFKH